jgi:hypothetical protein
VKATENFTRYKKAGYAIVECMLGKFGMLDFLSKPKTESLGKYTFKWDTSMDENFANRLCASFYERWEYTKDLLTYRHRKKPILA